MATSNQEIGVLKNTFIEDSLAYRALDELLKVRECIVAFKNSVSQDNFVGYDSIQLKNTKLYKELISGYEN